MKNSTLVFLIFSFFLLTNKVLAQQCLGGGCAFSGSQYPSATQSTTSATFVTVSTLIYAGEWQRYSVTSGSTYEWSLCSADGGSASYDSQLTLYQDDGSTILCYSDDACGDDGKIGWTASYTGFVRTKVNAYNCQTNSTATTLVWRRSSGMPPVGAQCSNPAVVSAFPYSASATTCGAGNDYGVQCSGNYGGGEDYVYQLNITTTGTYTIDVNATGGGSWIGWFLKGSANCANAASCLANATSSSGTLATGTYNFATAGTYFLIIDTWPSPDCSSYTIDITPPAPANDNCAGATNLTPTPGVYVNPGTQNSTNATSSGVTIPTCSGFTSNSALDVWYKFTTGTAGGNLTAVVTGSGGFDAVVEGLSGSCASPVSLGCIDGSTANGTESLLLTGLAPSTQYFLRVYGWFGGTGTFTISIAGQALPLELKSFSGKTEPTTNMLQWETLSEKNVQWHIIERSVDGLKWAEMGRKAGQMNSQASLEYELEDLRPLAKAYYRLRSVDFDGQENVSSSIILIRKGGHFGITAAFPSPAKDNITVQFESLTEESISIQLSDITGRLVLEQQFTADKGINEVPLELYSLQDGIYLVRISNSTSTAAPVRVVKE